MMPSTSRSAWYSRAGSSGRTSKVAESTAADDRGRVGAGPHELLVERELAGQHREGVAQVRARRPCGPPRRT